MLTSFLWRVFCEIEKAPRCGKETTGTGTDDNTCLWDLVIVDMAAKNPSLMLSTVPDWTKFVFAGHVTMHKPQTNGFKICNAFGMDFYVACD
eukprot:1294750-Karenia_brevis.AAC.1